MVKLSAEGNDGPGTTVGVNVALSGTLKDQNDISVFGMVEGEVISERAVTIGETAQVKGPVKGQLVTIAGVVRGSINALEKLEILETGRVFGSIDAKDLVVHSGATMVGKIEMPTEQSETESETPDEEPENEKNNDEQEEEIESTDLLEPDQE